MWLLRCRTHLLGDGINWLAKLQQGSFPTLSSPISVALWSAAAAGLRSISTPSDPAIIGLFSVLCGVCAIILYWLIAYELATADRTFFWFTFGIFGTLGLNQLFFGYIEAYPPAVVFGLAYVWMGTRATRTSTWTVLSGIMLGLAISTHLLNLYLLPSYAALSWLRPRRLITRLGLMAIPIAVSTLLVTLTGYRLGAFTAALHVPLHHSDHFAMLGPHAEPYAALSLAHAADILNELLLVMPVPLILLVAGVLSGALRSWRGSPTMAFLLAASIPGLAASSALMLPMPIAIDWDLHSLLLVPTAALGLWMCRSRLSLPRWAGVRAGLFCIGLASSAAFIAVNANERSGVSRSESIVGPDARITRYGVNYGDEVLVHYFRDRGDVRTAFRYARQLVEREPTSARYLALAGTLQYLQRSYSQAIPYLQAAVELQPDSLNTRTNLAICYSAIGRHSEALAEFREVLRAGPDAPEHSLNYALECANAGLFEDAKRTLAETLQRWPGYPPAVRAYRRVLETSPSRAPSP
jgi:hypothetical protein